MLWFLIVIAVLLLGYAAVLVSFVRRGRKIPPAAYLVLAAFIAVGGFASGLFTD